MSGPGAKDAVIPIPLAPKLNARSAPNDPLEQAGHLILDMVRQAAGNAQASNQQAVESSRKLSAHLRAAEDGYENLRQKSAITRTGRIEPKDGCIMCRSRLRRNSLAEKRRHHVNLLRL